MKALMIIALMGAGIAQAGTTYTLPDPAITVVVNETTNVTTATVGGVVYSGPSAFYYLSECSKPDTTRYHCNILKEESVALSAGGEMVTITLVIQSASTLITSGHNYWHHSTTVLSGDLTTP